MHDQPLKRAVDTRPIETSACNVALFRALVDGAREYAIFATDLDGRVITWNRGAERLIGYPEDEILGQPFSVIFTLEDRHDRVPEREMEAALRDGMVEDCRWHVRKDGTRFWAEETLGVLCDESNARIGFTQILRDVTADKLVEQEHASAEEALREANSRLLTAGIREQKARGEAETANRAKDEFLAIVSHELRTPLNAMLGWTQLLRANPTDPALAARALETIERNAMLQRTIIDDLFDVSRILSGSLRVTLCPVELVPLISSAVDSMRQAAEAKEVRLESVLDASIDPVSGDRERLHQVVSNLLSNAIKFTPAGGRIEVALARDDGYACIRVRDTGRGIQPGFLPYVFDRFRQADSTTQREFGGLGLGLAIVRYLVELQEGTVRAESDGEGRGATFTVLLPLARPAARGARPVQGEIAGDPLEETPRLDGVRVLVVDDDPDALAVYTLILEHTGAQIVTASSAREALALFDRALPDVLVSDIGMPGEDGFDLIHLVRERAPERGGRVPAAALTAYASGEDRERALRAGFQAHIGKPVEAARLVAVIAGLDAGRTGDMAPARTPK